MKCVDIGDKMTCLLGFFSLFSINWHKMSKASFKVANLSE